MSQAVSHSPALADSELVGLEAEQQEAIDRCVERTQSNVKMVDLATRLASFVAAVLGFFLLMAVIDHWVVGLTSWMRFSALLVLVGGLIWFLARRLLPVATQPVNPVYAAKTIEQAAPSLKNGLINLLLLSRQPQGVRPVIFSGLRRQAATQVAALPNESFVDHGQLIRAGYLLTALIGVAACYKLLSPKDLFQTVARVMVPWADIDRPARVQIEGIRPGDTELYRGQSLAIEANVEGLRGDENPVLVFHYGQAEQAAAQLAMSAGDDGRTYRANWTPDAQAASSYASYSIQAGDARTRDYQVQLLDAPHMAVERVTYEYPAYTGLAPRQDTATGDLVAIEGTRVLIDGRANQTIKQAYLELFSAQGTASGLSAKPVQALAMHAKAQLAQGRLTLSLAADRKTSPFAAYQLRFANDRGQSNDQPARYRIQVSPDLAPVVEILEPRQAELEVPVNRRVEFEVRALDPDFALTRVRLLGTVAQATRWDESLLKVSNHQGQWTGKATLVPESQGLKAGDELLVFAEAEDNRHSVAGKLEPNRARTDALRIRITSPDPAANSPNSERRQDDASNSSDGGSDDGNGDSRSGDKNASGKGEKRPSATDKRTASGNSRNAQKDDAADSDDTQQDAMQNDAREKDAGSQKGSDNHSKQSKGSRGKQSAREESNSGSNSNPKDSTSAEDESNSSEAEQTSDSTAKPEERAGQEKQGDKSSSSKDKEQTNREQSAGEKGESGGEESGAGESATGETGESGAGESTSGQNGAGESSAGESSKGTQQSSSGQQNGGDGAEGDSPSTGEGDKQKTQGGSPSTSRLGGEGSDEEEEGPSTGGEGDRSGRGGRNQKSSSDAQRESGETDAADSPSEESPGRDGSPNGDENKRDGSEGADEAPADEDSSSGAGRSAEATDDRNSPNAPRSSDAPKTPENAADDGQPLPSDGSRDGDAFDRILKHMQQQKRDSQAGEPGATDKSNSAPPDEGNSSAQTNTEKQDGAPESSRPKDKNSSKTSAQDKVGDASDEAKADENPGTDDEASSSEASAKANGKSTRDRQTRPDSGSESPSNADVNEPRQENDRSSSTGDSATKANDASPSGDQPPSDDPTRDGSKADSSKPKTEATDRDAARGANNPSNSQDDRNDRSLNSEKDSDRSKANSSDKNPAGSTPKGPDDETSDATAGSSEEVSEGAKGEGPEGSDANKTPDQTNTSDADHESGRSSASQSSQGKSPREQSASPKDAQQKPEEDSTKKPSAEDPAADPASSPGGTSDKNDGPGSESDRSSDQKSSAKTGQPSSRPPAGGEGASGPGAAGAEGSEDEAADAANLEYAKKATDMALEYLKHEPERDEVLKRLGWTPEELRAFMQRWQEMRDEAHEPQVSRQASERLSDQLRSLGLRPQDAKRRGQKAIKDVGGANRQNGSGSSLPPEYQEQYRAFLKSVPARQP